MDKNPDRPVLILIRGLPGSGKSYIAVELQKTLGKENVVSLDPDAIEFDTDEYREHVAVHVAEGVDEALFPYRFLRGKAYKGIADHKIIVWNQPFTNLEIFNKMVANFNIQADENNTTLPILVVEVVTKSGVARERVVKRKQDGGHGPSDNTFNRFENDFKTFKNEGYNVVEVNGEDPVAVSVETIVKALAELVK